MPQVAARFRLDQVNRTRGYVPASKEQEAKQVECAYVILYPVQGEPFGPATPSGKLEMLIMNPGAAQVFFDAAINTEFDILITEREK